MKKRIIIFGIFVTGVVGISHAQTNHKDIYPNSLYETGKELFQERVYSGSIQSLERFVVESKDDRLVAEAKYMIVCAQAELNQVGAEENIMTYMKEHPVSIHSNRLRFLLASAYYKQNDYDRSIHWFDQVSIDQLSTEEQEAFFYQLGYSYLQKREYSTAANLFKALEKNSVTYRDEAIYYGAYIQYCQQQYDKAESGFAHVKNHPKFEQEVAYYLLQIQYLRREFGTVMAAGKNLLKKYPNNAHKDEVYRLIGSSAYYSDDFETAVTYLTQYKSLNSQPLRNDMYLLGMSYYRLGDFKNALDNLSISVGGNDAITQNVYLHIGQCALKLGDKNRARISFEAASRYDFNLQVKEQAMYNYGLVIHETSFSPFNESLVVFERFLNQFPNSKYVDKVNDYMVETYLTTKNYEAALTSISKIKQPGSKIMEAKQNIYFQLGSQAFANSQFKEAAERFTQCIQTGDYSRDVKAEAYFWRGESGYRLDDYPAAVRDYQSYFSTNKNTYNEYFPLAHYNLAYAYMKQQQVGNAMNWFNKYVGITSEQSKPTYSDALNRLGDCHYYQRDWQMADSYYARALSNNPGAGDYALYQRAFVLGLKKQYAEKINLLDELIRDFSQSEYVDDAYYEKARAYVMMEKNNEAITVFNDLTERFPESAFSRKAGNQIGLLYFNSNRFNEAVAAFKKVISKYPGSEEAKMAMDDLKSVYLELNKIDEFADYVKTAGTGTTFKATEQDSLTYIAAERLFNRGDMESAKVSLESYLQNFPNGAFQLPARYYVGKIYFDKNEKSAALREFSKVLELPDNKFYEDALAGCADITYSQGDFEAALGYFDRLLQKAEKKENKEASMLGILRCANNLNRPQEAVVAANRIVGNTNVSPEVLQEAYYVRAKALQTQKQNEKAIADFKQIVKETRTVYGAEANYQLAHLYFEKKEMDQAEKTIFAFIERGTPHAYWMARSFILLSDVYLKKGDLFQAKEYLNSLKDNYKGTEDDIEQMIRERLNQIESEQPQTPTNSEQ